MVMVRISLMRMKASLASGSGFGSESIGLLGPVGIKHKLNQDHKHEDFCVQTEEDVIILDLARFVVVLQPVLLLHS